LRYFFHIGYNGSGFNGWQKLPQANSVQMVVETVLSQILKKDISVVGCGRTDTHVHAGQFFFHLDLEETWDFDLLFRVNKNLPESIAVFDILKVDDSSHARFDATTRTYDYFVHTYKDPFLSNVSTLWLEPGFDFLRIKDALKLLPQYSDYKAFCRTPAKHRTTIC
jgi:tRNA pseudouridine38-40 synthase